MAGKYEANTDEALAEALYAITMDGMHSEDSGRTEAPTGWFALVEDHEDSDWIVCEDDRGFVTVEGPFEAIDIDAGGYFSPARRRFDELNEAYSVWLDCDVEADLWV